MSEENTEAKAAPAEAPAEAKAQEMEKNHPERDLKSGEVFLKRKSGKPRWRKIVAKDFTGELFHYAKDSWVRKSAQSKQKGRWHDLRWHLSNKWVKVDKFTPTPRPPKKEKPAEAAPAA